MGSAIKRNLEAKGFTNFVTRSLDELNLLVETDVARFFAQEKPEYVVLAAAKVGGIVANNTYRAQFIYENLMIQNHIIHQSYLHGVKKLLFLGSSCMWMTWPMRRSSKDWDGSHWSALMMVLRGLLRNTELSEKFFLKSK